MTRLYQIVRIFLIAVFSLLVLFFLFMEFSLSSKALWIKNVDDTKFYTNYQNFHKFVFYDPYTVGIINHKQQALAELTGIISNRINSMRRYSSDKYFNEQLFSFYISQKIDDIKTITENYFLPLADFKDLVIIDKQMNLIFKYGTENFSVQYMEMSNNVEARYFDDRYALILKNDDPTIEYEYQIIALFDYSAFNDLLKEIDLPSFIFLKDRLMRNRQFPLPLFRNTKSQMDQINRKRFGLKILEIVPVLAGKFRMGYAGVLYPVRSLGSYLLFMFKLGLLALLGVSLILLDRWLFSIIVDRQIVKEEKRVFKKGSQPEFENSEEEVTDSNLEWVKHFIEESEPRKKP